MRAAYEKWLARQPLAPNTRRAYLGRVRQYCAYLDARANDCGNPLTDAHARDYAMRDFKSHLKKSRKLKPASVNLTLAALDHLSLFLGLGRPNVRREDLPQQAPRALEPDEQKRFLRAVERCPSLRDQAIAILLFYTGLRIGECAALDVDDVALSARKGNVIVRAGKAQAYREVALNWNVRAALAAWLSDRRARFANGAEPALFLNPQGRRLSVRSIDLALRRLSDEAGLALSAHILRHTCLTNLVRRGHDLVLVAEIAGHKRIETTRRYSLPRERSRSGDGKPARRVLSGAQVIADMRLENPLKSTSTTDNGGGYLGPLSVKRPLIGYAISAWDASARAMSKSIDWRPDDGANGSVLLIHSNGIMGAGRHDQPLGHILA